MSEDVVLDTLRTIRRLGTPTDRLFQSGHLREALGYVERSEQANKMHGLLQRLKQGGVIRATDSRTKRNQYLRVVDERALLRRIEEMQGAQRRRYGTGLLTPEPGVSISTAADLAGSGATPKRVKYLEERVQQLEDERGAASATVADLKGEVDMLRAVVHEVEGKIDALTEMWS